MPATEKQMDWDRTNTVQIKLKLNKVNDADILGFLDRCESKQGTIKELLRAAIKKENEQ